MEIPRPEWTETEEIVLSENGERMLAEIKPLLLTVREDTVKISFFRTSQNGKDLLSVIEVLKRAGWGVKMKVFYHIGRGYPCTSDRYDLYISKPRAFSKKCLCRRIRDLFRSNSG
jgi:hypothetical protein